MKQSNQVGVELNQNVFLAFLCNFLALSVSASHHSKSISGVFWKDGLTVNKEVSVRTGQQGIENILREGGLHWFGDVVQIDHQCRPQQALQLEVRYRFQERTRSPKDRLEWRGTVRKDLQYLTHQEEARSRDKNGIRMWPISVVELRSSEVSICPYLVKDLRETCHKYLSGVSGRW